MKEIVVGIDFSKSSLQALQYALRLSDVCNCNLKLVYVCKTRDKESRLMRDEKGMDLSIAENFHKLIAEQAPSYQERITYKILEGKIWEEISNQAKYTIAEMIVIGAHGMSGFEELWIGNNAMKIVAHSEKPVLCVKKNQKFKKELIEKIVIPIDHTRCTLQKIPFTLELAQSLKAQLNVLSLFNSKHTHNDEIVEQNTQKAMELVIASGLRYINEKRVSENNALSTIEYAVKRSADLISIHTENESFHSVFMGNMPQTIINQSPVPVLSTKANVMTIVDKQQHLNAIH